MVNSQKKGVTPKKVAGLNQDLLGRVDLSTLPKFLSFKASMEHSVLTLKYVLLVVVILWGVQFSVDKFHDLEMARQYRMKEFLLAPSDINGITPVKPQVVPDSYVDDVTTTYLSLLGNVNPVNVQSNYAILSRYMTDQLKIQFHAEIEEWVETVKHENISEILKVISKKIVVSEGGFYKVEVSAKRDRYTGGQYLGQTREKIEMTLQIVPPSEKRRWYLQINSLSRGDK